MFMNLSNTEQQDAKIDANKLKSLLSKFDSDSNTLEMQLESTLKHLKSYIKVIKSHFLQLQKVMKTEAHGYKDVENLDISDQVQELMQLFDKLENEDIQMIDELASIAKRWTISSEKEKKENTYKPF